MNGWTRPLLIALLLPWTGLVSAGEEPLPPVWQEARERGVVLRAVGNEPGWLLELDGDGRVLLATDYGAWRRNFIVSASEQGTEFTASVDGLPLHASIVTAPCNDTMSDRRYPLRVTVTHGDRTFRGCGFALD
jgi:uncharacterized membrane protein